MLIAICNGHEIRQVDIVSIINTVHSVLLNCAVASHMFLEWHLFFLYHLLTNDKYITVSRHHYVPIVDIESVTFTIILPNGTSKLTFTNTLYILTLEADLISLGVLHYKDASVQSWKKDLIILKNDNNLFSAILSGLTSTLYQIQYTDFNCRSTHISAGTFSMCLWYCKIRHLSPHIIYSIVCQKTIHGFNVFTPKEFDHLYNGCVNGKFHCLPLSESSASQYSKMELLVMDLTRLMSVSTWDGYLYLLIVVEVSCCYAVSHLLKEKEKASIAI